MSTAAIATKRRRPRSKWTPYITFLRYAALLFFACFFLMPVYALVVTGLKDPGTANVVSMWALPEKFSLDSFSTVWPVLQDGFVNSLLLAIPASIISAMLGAANGFVLAKWRFPGAD